MYSPKSYIEVLTEVTALNDAIRVRPPSNMTNIHMRWTENAPKRMLRDHACIHREMTSRGHSENLSPARKGKRPREKLHLPASTLLVNSRPQN